jgi:hypothetical protein
LAVELDMKVHEASLSQTKGADRSRRPFKQLIAQCE